MNAHQNFINRFNTYWEQEKQKIKDEFKSKSSGKGEKPIKVRRYEENNILLDVFNYPALLNSDFGFLHLLNHCQVLFNAFFEQIKDLEKNEKEDKFISFFTSFMDEDIEEIQKLSGIRYDDDKFHFLKNSMDLLVSYFDLESVKSDLKTKLDIYNNNKYKNKIIGSSALGIASLIAVVAYFSGVNSSLLLIGGGIGVVIGIGLTAYFCYKKYTVDKSLSKIEEDKIRKNMHFIEKFFDRMKIETEKNNIKSNVFIIAIDKSTDNYGDFIFQPYILRGINSIDSPKLDNYTDNMNNYNCYLKGLDFFKKKYEKKVNEANSNDISKLAQEFINDLNTLSGKKTVKDIERLLKEEEEKQKAAAIITSVNTTSSTNVFPNPNNEVLDVEEKKILTKRNEITI